MTRDEQKGMNGYRRMKERGDYMEDDESDTGCKFATFTSLCARPDASFKYRVHKQDLVRCFWYPPQGDQQDGAGFLLGKKDSNVWRRNCYSRRRSTRSARAIIPLLTLGPPAAPLQFTIHSRCCAHYFHRQRSHGPNPRPPTSSLPKKSHAPAITPSLEAGKDRDISLARPTRLSSSVRHLSSLSMHLRGRDEPQHALQDHRYDLAVPS